MVELSVCLSALRSFGDLDVFLIFSLWVAIFFDGHCITGCSVLLLDLFGVVILFVGHCSIGCSILFLDLFKVAIFSVGRCSIDFACV